MPQAPAYYLLNGWDRRYPDGATMIHLPQTCKRFLPLIVATLAGAAPVSAGGFNPETFTLANGMQVVVVPNHRVPIVTHMVW